MSLIRQIKQFFIGKITASLFITWTLLIAISAFWNFYQNTSDTVSKARIEANTIFQHNLAYRKWSTMHGGIYTRITDKNKSNPHFIMPMTGDGSVAFAMIDPSLMTKQAYDVLHKQSPSLATINRTVSLDFQSSIDPYDEPDPWETEALIALQNENKEEVSAVIDINKKPYLRLLKPYVIDKGCLRCHGSDKYKVGEVRAGMSIAVPMDPYYNVAFSTKQIILLTHLLLWLLGCLAISIFSSAFKKYRETIIESEEKFRIVSEFAYNFEYWIKADNTLAFISPSCERLTGYTREEFTANPKLLLDMVHPDDIEKFRTHVNQLDSPCHEGSDYRIVTKQGKTRWFSHTCSPININGIFLGRRSSSMDITEHKELEEQLQKAKQLEYLGQFAGGIAHDFNNVLGSINTFTHLIHEEVKESNKLVLDYIKYIKIAAKLGKNMTSNLLSFGKRQIIKPKKTTLNTIIQNISDILKSLVDEDTKYLFILADPDLEISADPHQVEQILINLCTNARDAMRTSGGTITIKSEATRLTETKQGALGEIPPRQYMAISVADTGEGISPENFTKICEPFFTTKDATKGTGLGMSIILNIVKQHNAFIDIKSEPGVGTTFTIYFSATGPAKKNHVHISHKRNTPEEEPTEVKEPIQQKPSRSLNSATILLVDDDELIRKSISLPLERMGYNILLAENGKKAISQYIDHKEDINLVILDVILPYKNGKEVYDIIRKDNKKLNVIFISGYTDNILSEETINEPGVHFLSKPIDLETLLKTIRGLV